MTGPVAPRRRIVEVEEVAELSELLDQRTDLGGVVINGIDLTTLAARLGECELDGAVLIGCTASPDLLASATLAGAAVFPTFENLPYRPYRKMLYGVDDLYAGFDPGHPESYDDTLDARVYRHWSNTGGQGGGDIVESLARRIHDHSITDAIEDFIEARDVVAIMGGHSLRRDAPGFASVARIARALARTGKLLASGGGPGAMEATHLGAWMADHPDPALDDAITMLCEAPAFTPIGPWLAAAFRIRDRYPPTSENSLSLGVPTWLYGHEPPNAFATHIAKYFANAVREDGLLTIARHGVIFTPGSAGTVQEIFQDTTQNHYETAGPPSPMVFFGSKFWSEALPVLPLIERLGTTGRGDRLPWLDQVVHTDDEAEVVAAIANHDR